MQTLCPLDTPAMDAAARNEAATRPLDIVDTERFDEFTGPMDDGAEHFSDEELDDNG